ncbi:ABC transporter ATP-binding protein [Butyrivibrio sp. YAB3001]|uniref:ABC transporter ATP-binding protein n=1 Tax=Butyrivibrio sp. YAB3001 TaxID=1520812 RepID=UPI0008F6290D|nr:ATP-binding cassette domain-containing protein [Butyrivibrio sp. YAB3001]SFC02392.1 ABC-2 type transport system ATP-binding protein [Butyrivibrio sp. YAB3001]
MGLVIKDFCKQYGDFKAVDNITFEAKDGQILGLLGRNGAGKTTTIKCIMGILTPTSGSITYDGQSISKEDVAIGYLPEERGLYLSTTVKKQLLYFGMLNGMSKAEAMKEILRLLERFGISDRLNSKVKSLSKGNKQKVQLISAILHKPKIVIMDEPFSGLDPVNAELFKSVIKDLKEAGTTVIFSSHRMEDVEEMCDRVVLMKQGHIIENDTVENLIAKNSEVNEVIITVDGDISELIHSMNFAVISSEGWKYKLRYKDENELKQLYSKITNNGIGILEVIHPKVTMQEIFLEKMA